MGEEESVRTGTTSYLERNDKMFCLMYHHQQIGCSSRDNGMLVRKRLCRVPEGNVGAVLGIVCVLFTLWSLLGLSTEVDIINYYLNQEAHLMSLLTHPCLVCRRAVLAPKPPLRTVLLLHRSMIPTRAEADAKLWCAIQIPKFQVFLLHFTLLLHWLEGFSLCISQAWWVWSSTAMSCVSHWGICSCVLTTCAIAVTLVKPMCILEHRLNCILSHFPPCCFLRGLKYGLSLLSGR